VPHARWVIVDSAEFTAAGIVPAWSRRSAEHTYLGRMISWESVRDADPNESPPELRLKDGRTVFVSAMLRDDLVQALEVAGIDQVRRPPIWDLLLEPFLDTEISRETNQAALADLGFTRREVRHIRRRLMFRMIAMTVLTWEWEHYGQADAIDAYTSFRFMPRFRYRRFRAWTDEIAERTGPSK